MRTGIFKATLLSLALLAGNSWAGGGSPQVNYMLHCSGCHGAEGAGSPSDGIPDMRGALGHFLKAPGGREFLIQVPGTSQASLGDADVAVLMNWMLKRFSPAEVPAGTPPYTEAEVRRLRAAPLADVPAVRERIVAALKAQGISID